MKKQLELSDFQLGMYRNTTRVGLDKLKFSSNCRAFVEKAIKDILDQIATIKESGIAPTSDVEAKIPYSIFPDVRKAVGVFNKKHTTNYLILYHKHLALGILKEDNPLCLLVCPECKLAMKSEDVPVSPPKKRWQKALKFFFRQAFTPIIPERQLVCRTHGKVEDYLVMNI